MALSGQQLAQITPLTPLIPLIPRSGAIALGLLLWANASFSALILWVIVLAVGCIILSAQQQKASLERQVEARTVQLQASMAELEELSSLQDVLLYAISHDLRTTMMGSLMILENVQEHVQEHAREQLGVIPVQREVLQRMTQSGRLQLNRLNMLLETHAHVMNGMTVKKRLVSVREIVAGAIADLTPLLTENQATLINQTADLKVMADPAALRQVFHQIITNAIKHNSPGVEICLEATLNHSTTQFTITDNGIGIDPLEQTQVFNLRLKPQQERQLTRISLGLCLCKQIMAAHGGEIGVEGELGEGTKIWFTLPQ
jgi:signal transduction histidine kinase